MLSIGDEVFLVNNGTTNTVKVWTVFAIEGPYVVLQHGTSEYAHGIRKEDVRKVLSVSLRRPA